MIRRWWRSLGFFWQVYLFMVATFGAIISFVEGVVEPLALDSVRAVLGTGTAGSETAMWAISVLLPTLPLGYAVTRMVMRKLDNTVKMAERLSRGDLGARIAAEGQDRDVFNKLASAFNNMADSLERLLSHEKRLLADISHELRSPLTRMGVATALLPMKRDAGDFDATIQVLEHEIEQMNGLVGLLLEQGRERLRLHSDLEAVDLTALAHEVAEAFAMITADEGKNLAVGIAPGVVVWGQPLRIRMILENIVSNALFYSPEGGTVDLRVMHDSDYAFVSVRDRGPGVPDKYLQDIFTAFFRVDQSRARTSGGVGLGLALAKDAAVAMGGDIEAVNAGPGLKVTVTLPRLGI